MPLSGRFYYCPSCLDKGTKIWRLRNRSSMIQVINSSIVIQTLILDPILSSYAQCYNIIICYFYWLQRIEIQCTVKGKAQIIERNLRIFIETKDRNVAGPQEHQKPCNKHFPNSWFSFTILLNPSYYPLLVPSPTIYPFPLLAYSLWFPWWKPVCVSFVSPSSSTQWCSKTWTWLAFDHKAHKSWEWKPLARFRPLPIL